MVKNSGMCVPVWKSGQQQKEAAGVESHRRLKAVKSAGSRSNRDGLFCAGITQLRTWLNSPPWLWLPETYCTLHNWYPIGKCLVLGSGCVLVPEERHQSPATCRKVLLCLFPKLLPFSWSHSPDSAGGLQRDAGLPGVGVWYTQVGSKASTRSLAKNAAKACGLEHESDDDSYEVLDLTEYARRHHWWNRVFGRNSGPIVEKYSVATQIVMGGVTGWCAGFLFQKVGKLAATAVGGGFLLLQIASHSGYVQVDWKRVEKDVNKAKKQLKKRANKAAPEINTLIEESTEFIKQNIVVSSGFVGGFLLGLAS
nr:FUN14 domain-containing protein 1 [Columba livia]